MYLDVHKVKGYRDVSDDPLHLSGDVGLSVL